MWSYMPKENHQVVFPNSCVRNLWFSLRLTLSLDLKAQLGHSFGDDMGYPPCASARTYQIIHQTTNYKSVIHHC